MPQHLFHFRFFSLYLPSDNKNPGLVKIPVRPKASTTTSNKKLEIVFLPEVLKMFFSLTKGLSDGIRIGDSTDQATKLLDFLKQKKSSFGTCVNRVPIKWDPTTGAPTNWASIIDQYQTIKMDALVRAAHKRYLTELTLADPVPPASNSNLWVQVDINPATFKGNLERKGSK